MRWYFIDRFVEFRTGERAVAVKQVPMYKDTLDATMPAFPVFPNSLIVEGMAQVGGILIAEQHGFQRTVVLAKLATARFLETVTPGDSLRYEVELRMNGPDGGMAVGTSFLNRRVNGPWVRQAEVELWFGYLDDQLTRGSLLSAEDFARLSRALRLEEAR